MMLIRTNAALALLAFGALFGCSATAGSESDAGTDGVTAPLAPAPGTDRATTSERELRKVAEISIAGSTIELAQLAGMDASPIVVSEHFDLSRGSVLERLTKEQPLTSLEIFVSLNPEGAAPHALYEHHAAEAAALGRSDRQSSPPVALSKGAFANALPICRITHDGDDV